MNPQEALLLLDRAVALLSANREVHIKLVSAVEVLRAAIEIPKEQEKASE